MVGIFLKNMKPHISNLKTKEQLFALLQMGFQYGLDFHFDKTPSLVELWQDERIAQLLLNHNFLGNMRRYFGFSMGYMNDNLVANKLRELEYFNHYGEFLLQALGNGMVETATLLLDKWHTPQTYLTNPYINRGYYVSEGELTPLWSPKMMDLLELFDMPILLYYKEKWMNDNIIRNITAMIVDVNNALPFANLVVIGKHYHIEQRYYGVTEKVLRFSHKDVMMQWFEFVKENIKKI